MTPFDILTSSGKHPDRPIKWPPNEALINNAMELASRLSHLLLEFARIEGTMAKERQVTSGYRPKEVNDDVPNAAANSHHIRCLAADIEDSNGMLAKYCMTRQDLLEQFALWMEDPEYTRTIEPGTSKKLPLGQQGWVHLQSVPPKSGHRVFIPYAGGPP
jgi:hypothetical protein